MLRLELSEAVTGLALQPLQRSNCFFEALRDVGLAVGLHNTHLVERALGAVTELGEGLGELGAQFAKLFTHVAAETVEFRNDWRGLGFGLQPRFQGNELLVDVVHGAVEVVEMLASQVRGLVERANLADAPEAELLRCAHRPGHVGVPGRGVGHRPVGGSAHGSAGRT